MNNILLIEYEKIERQKIAAFFRRNTYNVTEASTKEDGFKRFVENDIDLVILDVESISSGLELCKKIREISRVLIIMMGSPQNIDEELQAYELGVDDFLIKPIHLKALLAKSNNIMIRRQNYIEALSKKEHTDIYKCGILIKKEEQTILIDERPQKLAPKEFKILLLLMENEGKVLSRETILDKVWGIDYYGNYRVVDTQIKKLRKKLSHKAKYIETVISAGYKFRSNV